jgi:hypothetical protein
MTALQSVAPTVKPDDRPTEEEKQAFRAQLAQELEKKQEQPGDGNG